MIYALIICIVLIGFLGFKLYQKQQIDQTELENYSKELETVRQLVQNEKGQLASNRATCAMYKEQANAEQEKLRQYRIDLRSAMNEYTELTDRRMQELNDSIAAQREARENELSQELEVKNKLYEKLIREAKLKSEVDIKSYEDAALRVYEEKRAEIEQATTETEYLKSRYEALLAPIQQLEKDRLARVYYTIQLSEELQPDIEYLLTTVAEKVEHPDIINKLVWAEYVRPNLDELFKRTGIEAKPGIYKLTSLVDGRAYIGKSTNVKSRIADHFKASIGIATIAHQAVHDAIRKQGFWNWTVEVIIYSDKEKLSELEKYYIEFFDTQAFGWNKREGG